MKCIYCLCVFVFLSTAVSGVCNAQGTARDQYRQMGSVAAIAETCYGSKAIPEKLNALVKQAAATNPASAETLKSLVAEYNDAYKYALVNMVVWNGTTQSYSKNKFSCSNSSDVETIKKLEKMFLDNLR